MSIYFDFKTIGELSGDNFRNEETWSILNEPLLNEEFNWNIGDSRYDTRVTKTPANFTPDDWVRYITPIINYAITQGQQGSTIDPYMYQRVALLGVLVGRGKTPREAIDQLQEWQDKGELQLLKYTNTGTTGTTGMTGTTGTSTGNMGQTGTQAGGGTTGGTGTSGGMTTGGTTSGVGTQGGLGTTGGMGTGGIFGGFGTPGTSGGMGTGVGTFGGGTGTAGGMGTPTGGGTRDTSDEMLNKTSDRLILD
ncbi:hypothetical protein [Clostridium saccharoperbutylacetonicum]|uniref:hypothetical protein n=1 Tax=Clostridium saccharoperbutylacetonicum TaxID=36745 RepID=UPI0039EBC647